MSGIEQLLHVARVYAAIEKIELSTVSSRVFNDGKKLAAIEAGADITVGRLERAMRWFSAFWPDGDPWPEGVSRPALPSSTAAIEARP